MVLYRVEDKYFCSEKELFLLQAKLKVILRSDENQFDDMGYKITSVYFDSLDDRCFREAEGGIRRREKFRVRIYNDSFETIKLEVKDKLDSRIDKKSCSISFEQMKSLLRGDCIEEQGGDGSTPITRFNLAIKTEKLSPRIIVEYDRKAFTFSPGNVRITLDRNIRMSTDIESFLAGNTGAYRMLPDFDRILEIKYDEFLPGFIARVLENGNMMQTSCSKYRLCREAEGCYDF